MEKYILIIGALVALLLLAGCTGEKPDLADSIGNIKDAIANKPRIEEKERVDAWEPSMKLSDCTAEELTVPTAEAKAVPVIFTEEERKDEWDSYTGGADAEYATASVESGAPENIRKIIDDYNGWVLETTESEMAAARERWELYHAVDPDDFIALTPRVGMHLMRSDTSVFSYMTETYCYNRDYEPDMRLVHGYTFDAASGRQLTLQDLITDTDAMAELICQSLQTANGSYSSEATKMFTEQEFRDRVKESLDGCRDDGLFAWTVSPAGFEFYLVDPFLRSEYLLHFVERAFVPFSLCEDILCQDLSVSYDHIVPISYGFVKTRYGQDRLEGMQEKGYYSAYLVQKDEKQYLYLCDEGETLVYTIADGSPKLTGRVIGELAPTDYSAYEVFPNPSELIMDHNAFLVRELLELSAKSHVGDDGIPVYDELFRDEYNVEPMSVLVSFEAEVFTDENDTEPEIKTLPQNTWLNFLRTDGESFIDLTMEYEEGICRFYVTGDYEKGFKVNGHPVEEVLNLNGWLEE
ncbi:MAG: hypothetical protein K5649_03565 [Lachnospiraceae bacterium]|nr:hypothetical protein [Lachnospiraceae bacterium]